MPSKQKRISAKKQQIIAFKKILFNLKKYRIINIDLPGKKVGKGAFDNENKKQRNFAFDNDKVANNSIDYRFLIDISNPGGR